MATHVIRVHHGDLEPLSRQEHEDSQMNLILEEMRSATQAASLLSLSRTGGEDDGRRSAGEMRGRQPALAIFAILVFKRIEEKRI